MKKIALLLLFFGCQASSTPVPGGLFIWDIPIGAKNIRYQGKPVFFMSDKAVVGIPISKHAGTDNVEYSINGKNESYEFLIMKKTYSEQHITIKDQSMVSPSAADLKRINEESRRQNVLYNSYSPALDLSQGFLLPIEGKISSLFGHRRFFNGQPRSPHSGLDIAASKGTPIRAPAAGKVVLSDELYFNGKTIFVDHGRGLVSMYCHMSESKALLGSLVKQQEIIGLVGSTGRATGPHLHWSVSLNGIRVDPTSLTRALNTITNGYDASYVE